MSIKLYMEIVFAALFSLAAFCIIAWIALLVKSFAAERQRLATEASEAAERERLLQKDAERYHTREMLRCLDCNFRFPGPLTSSGCPECHRESLVVKDSDLPNESQRIGSVD